MTIAFLLEVSSAALICIGMSTVLSLAVVKLTGLSVRTFLPSLIFPNSGNMGLPLVLLAFGEEGLQLAVAHFVIVALLQHSVGATISSGNFTPGSLLKQPLIYAVICVLLVILTNVQVPGFVMSTTKFWVA